MQQYDLRDYIRLKRTGLKLGLNEFALTCEMSSSTLSTIESKKFHIKYPTLEKIAEGFCMTPSEFLAEYEEYCKNISK